MMDNLTEIRGDFTRLAHALNNRPKGTQQANLDSLVIRLHRLAEAHGLIFEGTCNPGARAVGEFQPVDRSVPLLPANHVPGPSDWDEAHPGQ